MAYRMLGEEAEEEVIPKKKSNLDFLKDFAVESLATASKPGYNALTAVTGLPGDILSFANVLGGKAASLITGDDPIPYEETLIGKIIPSSHQQRAAIEEVLPDLAPKNAIEELLRGTQDIALSFYSPGTSVSKAGKVLTSGQKTLKNLFKGLGAELSGEAVESVSGSKEAGDWTRLGAGVVLHGIDQPGTKARIGNMYEKARSAIRPTDMMDGRGLVDSMDKLIYSITKNRPMDKLSAGERWVVDQAEKAKGLVNNGQLSVEQGWAQLDTINKELQNKLPEFRGETKGVERKAKVVSGALNSALENYGRTNPEFWENFAPAQEASRAIHQSNFVSRALKKHVKNELVTEGLGALFGLGTAVKTGFAPAATAYQSAKLITRIVKSPTLRKMYIDINKEAIKGNGVLAAKLLSKMDHQLQKEESERKAPYRLLE